MTAGDFNPACLKYGESYHLDPQLGTLLHLADCYEKAGKIASAWANFKDAIEVASRRNWSGQKEPREQLARSRAAALEPRLARLSISVSSADPALEVLQDERLVGRGTWGSAVPVDPGLHTVSARSPGKRTWARSIEVSASGGRIDLVVPELEPENGSAPPSMGPMGPVPMQQQPMQQQPVQQQPMQPYPPQQPMVQQPPPPMPATPPPPAPVEATSRGGSAQKTIGFVVGGAGVVGLGTGLAFGLMRNANVDERDKICPSSVHCSVSEGERVEELTDQGKKNATVSNIAFGVGGAALLLGAVLVLTAGDSKESGKPSAQVHIRSWSSPTSAGASLGGSW